MNYKIPPLYQIKSNNLQFVFCNKDKFLNIIKDFYSHYYDDLNNQINNNFHQEVSWENIEFKVVAESKANSNLNFFQSDYNEMISSIKFESNNYNDDEKQEIKEYVQKILNSNLSDGLKSKYFLLSSSVIENEDVFTYFKEKRFSEEKMLKAISNIDLKNFSFYIKKYIDIYLEKKENKAKYIVFLMNYLDNSNVAHKSEKIEVIKNISNEEKIDIKNYSFMTEDKVLTFVFNENYLNKHKTKNFLNIMFNFVNNKKIRNFFKINQVSENNNKLKLFVNLDIKNEKIHDLINEVASLVINNLDQNYNFFISEE